MASIYGEHERTSKINQNELPGVAGLNEVGFPI